MSDLEDKARAALEWYLSDIDGPLAVWMHVDDVLKALAPIFAELEGEIARLKAEALCTHPRFTAADPPICTDCGYRPTPEDWVAEIQEPAGDVVTVDLSNRAMMAELSFAWSHGWPGSIELSDIIRSHAIKPTAAPEPCPTTEALTRENANLRATVNTLLNTNPIAALKARVDELERRYDLHHHGYKRTRAGEPDITDHERTSCPVDPPE